VAGLAGPGALMLTGDLIRARIRGRDIEPSLIDTAKPSSREAATTLFELLSGAVTERQTRGHIQETIDDILSERRDHKIWRGMAKLLFDRSEFEVESPMDPIELRKIVFERARQMGPLAFEAGPFARPVAADVFAAVAADHDLTPEQVRLGLYADLKQSQRIVSCKVDSPEGLADRYNVALVQALLCRASDVTVSLHAPSAHRMRQLFRYVKFHQLIHTAHRDGPMLTLRLDGPTSLFAQSTRYGMQLANFFPGLLLQECPWNLEATILWTKRRLRKRLTLTHEAGLRSHYLDRGAYRTREQEWFAERFEKLNCKWKMTEGEAPINLGGRAVIFPDFTFRKGRKTAHLEILGFWRKDSLSKRIALLERYGPGNLILAVSRKLRGSKDALEGHSGTVIDFAEIVPPKKVLAAIESVAKSEKKARPS
jgi:predicted nuclease of restriction endonuclease-like RecB superfamily